MDYNVHSNKSTLTILPLPKRYIRTYDFGLFMRPITISLDSITWELAKRKTNFSAWVRDQLRSERNKEDSAEEVRDIKARRADKMEELLPITTSELLYHLEIRSDAEINALVSILKGSLSHELVLQQDNV